MKTRIILGPEELARLADLRAYAESHPLGPGRLRVDDEHYVTIPIGCMICFSVLKAHGEMRRLFSASIECLECGGRHPPWASDLQRIGRLLGLRMDPFDPSTESIFGREGNDLPTGISILEPMETTCDERLKPGPGRDG